MLLWLAFSLVAAAVVAILVRPLLREADVALDPVAADVAVYKDQLSEIVADRERGLIGAAEAEAAHAEVARRLLSRQARSRPGAPSEMRSGAADGSAASPLASEGASRASVARLTSPKVVSALVAILLPLGSMALYLKVGSPGLPAQPREARLKAPAETANLDQLVAKVEARLREQPGDGQGWDVLAPVYMVLERHEDAANAYARAIALLGESPKRLAGLAEAHVLVANGMVNETARLAYERLRTIEPSRLEPRFWLALAKEQDGRRDLAAADYRALLDEAPADAPWRPMVEARLKEVTGQAAGAAPEAPGSQAPGAPAPRSQAPVSQAPAAMPPGPAAAGGASSARPGAGPSADDVAAASRMTPAERAAMIERMVEGLATRLKTNGKDLGGWLNLVRAYTVLGRRGDAVAALAEARGNLAGDGAALSELDALARSLGLGS